MLASSYNERKRSNDKRIIKNFESTSNIAQNIVFGKLKQGPLNHVIMGHRTVFQMYSFRIPKIKFCLSFQS